MSGCISGIGEWCSFVASLPVIARPYGRMIVWPCPGGFLVTPCSFERKFPHVPSIMGAICMQQIVLSTFMRGVTPYRLWHLFNWAHFICVKRAFNHQAPKCNCFISWHRRWAFEHFRRLPFFFDERTTTFSSIITTFMTDLEPSYWHQNACWTTFPFNQPPELTCRGFPGGLSIFLWHKVLLME